MSKFIIIDGNSLMNRAFYALPMLKSLSGKPCNATFGFVKMMTNLILNEKPEYLVCVFDAGKHTFRHDIYAEYKGKRDKTPEDLVEQLKDIKKLLGVMGIKTIEKAEIEADDIIGTLTRRFNEDFFVVSGDRDMLQLINKNTTVCLTKKGVAEMSMLDEEKLKEEYGVEPYQIIELKAIMGDSSDNIPGVPGIGKVGAEKLIAEYKNLDNIYANINNIAGATQKKLIEGKDMAYLSKTLATIKLDVDLDVQLEECRYKLPFNSETALIFEDLGFKSILNKKELFNEIRNQHTEEIEFTSQIIEIDSQEKFDKMISSLTSSFSIIGDGLMFVISCNDVEYVLYTSGEIFNNNLKNIQQLLAGEKQKICFDAKTLMHSLSLYDIELNNYFDVAIAIYVANEMDAEISLEEALKLNNIFTENKASALIKLKEIYVTKLINSLQLKLFSDIELPLVEVLYNMEKDGIKIDVEQIKTLSKIYHEELNQLTTEIYKFAGEEFNINSPKQLQGILFDKLKIEFKGKLSTSIEVLNAIKDKHEIVPIVIRYRKIAKLISTYLDGMLNYVKEDGKIHTTFMQRTTSTGRLSSREPNLQNLPIRDEEGKALRKMFSSSFENGTLISADYNQIELRLMANFSKDENMIADYLSGKDIHTATASKIFGVNIEDVSPSMRRVAKSVNFGIIYGISGFGLAQNIGSTQKEALDFIKKYMEIYPKVKEYGEECVQKSKETGYSSTLMGRVRHIADINSSNHTIRAFGERVAKNMPLQGSASDIIKIAMIKVFNRIKKEKLKSKLIIQIHDELVVDCYPGESEKIRQILKEEMESVVDLTVPLIVEVEEGKTLFDAK